MIINKTVLIGIWIAVGIYLLYKYLLNSKTSEKKSNFEKDYNKILSSEEYKVKGQYDK